MSDIPQLDEVAQELVEGRTAVPVTVRTFLSWFHVMRRTRWNVEHINGKMAEADLRTVPSYLDTWIDNPITFELISKHQENSSSGDATDDSQAQTSSAADKQDASEVTVSDDPSFRIGRILSATIKPTSVAPNATLKEAMTLMLVRDFSQIPVMTTERDVKGVVSWASIGARLAVNKSGPDVQSYMESHHELSLSASLFTAIQVIREHNYVLTRSKDNKIAGIVTADDIALEFELISTPFLLLAEIENNLRSLIGSRLTLDEIRIACGEVNLRRDVVGVADLNFGNYVRIFEHVESWGRINLQLDRSSFCSELSDVNKIRNEVMHFAPDPIQPHQLSKLRNVARMLDMFRQMGAL